MLTLGFELKTLARLSVPVALSQLGMTAMGAIDTLLLGHVGVDELAAAALGNVWDRLQYGAVADFINMSCCGIRNPFAFNVADAAIFGGAALLILAGRATGRDATRRVR